MSTSQLVTALILGVFIVVIGLMARRTSQPALPPPPADEPGEPREPQPRRRRH